MGCLPSQQTIPTTSLSSINQLSLFIPSIIFLLFSSIFNEWAKRMNGVNCFSIDGMNFSAAEAPAGHNPQQTRKQGLPLLLSLFNQPTPINSSLFCFGGIDGIGLIGCLSFLKEKTNACSPIHEEEKRRKEKTTLPIHFIRHQPPLNG